MILLRSFAAILTASNLRTEFKQKQNWNLIEQPLDAEPAQIQVYFTHNVERQVKIVT